MSRADINVYLSETRAQLDKMDRALLQLLADRRAVVKELFERKSQAHMPLIDPEREQALLAERHAWGAELNLPSECIEQVMAAILNVSHADADVVKNLAHSIEPR
ncbi:MAG: chorismate mutase [Polyangiaceae bacterium]|nr:chorismate mutase [Polyangiaceae bacterium]